MSDGQAYRRQAGSGTHETALSLLRPTSRHMGPARHATGTSVPT
jgi:hypothetical protein